MGATVAGEAALGVAPGCNVPHFVQNFAPARLTNPQFGQPFANGAPHSMQKLASSAFLVAHRAQIKSNPSCSGSAANSEASIRPAFISDAWWSVAPLLRFVVLIGCAPPIPFCP